MRIVFVYAEGRLQRLQGVEAGEVATEFFYGGIQLQRRGHAVKMYELQNEYKSSVLRSALEVLYRLQLLPSKTLPALIVQVFKLRSMLNKCDVIVATATGIAYGLGLMRLLGLIRPEIVAIHCGLINFRLKRRRRLLNGFILRRSWIQLYGEGELVGAKEMFRVPERRIEINQFGVDTKFWTPGKEKCEGYILSVGNDARRDYELLARVAARICYPSVIVTNRQIDCRLAQNVKIVRGDWHSQQITDRKLRDMYRKAACVVIPLKDSWQPSGQSVCLQAMACGKPVIITRTKGLWSDKALRDRENVMFVDPGNTEQLESAILRLMGDVEVRSRLGMAARSVACQHGSIDDFATRLEKKCIEVVKA